MVREMQKVRDIVGQQDRDSSPVICGPQQRECVDATAGVLVHSNLAHSHAAHAPLVHTNFVSSVQPSRVAEVSEQVAGGPSASGVRRVEKTSGATQAELPPARPKLDSTVQLRLDDSPRDRCLEGCTERQRRSEERPEEHTCSNRGSASATSLRDPADDVEQGRATRVWREWLTALARDPEAALAAAQAYEQLDEDYKDEWLRILDKEGASLGVPRVALYAPLLAVESNPQRLLDILHRAAAEVQTSRERVATARPVERRALCGDLSDDVRLAVLVEPLYLDFVHVLACAYVPGHRFVWVRHDPIASGSEVVGHGGSLQGVRVERTPVKAMVDELARTIVAHRRGGEPLPEALRCFADLFGLDEGIDSVARVDAGASGAGDRREDGGCRSSAQQRSAQPRAKCDGRSMLRSH
jgi:hypothetical protein